MTKIEKRRKLKHNTRIKKFQIFMNFSLNYHYLVFVLFVVGWDLFFVWIIEIEDCCGCLWVGSWFYYYCSMLKKLVSLVCCLFYFSFLTTIFTFFRTFKGDNLKLIELGDKVRLTSIKVDFFWGDSWELNYSNQLLTNLFRKMKWNEEWDIYHLKKKKYINLQ